MKQKRSNLNNFGSSLSALMKQSPKRNDRMWSWLRRFHNFKARCSLFVRAHTRPEQKKSSPPTFYFRMFFSGSIKSMRWDILFKFLNVIFIEDTWHIVTVIWNMPIIESNLPTEPWLQGMIDFIACKPRSSQKSDSYVKASCKNQRWTASHHGREIYAENFFVDHERNFSPVSARLRIWYVGDKRILRVFFATVGRNTPPLIVCMMFHL